MGIFGQTTRWVWAVAIASSTLAAPLWADEAPMMMDIVVDSEVRCGNVLLRDDSVWFYEKVSKQLTGLVAKEPVVALVDPQGPGGAPGGPSAEGPKPEAQKPQTAPADAGGAKDPKATKILVRPKDGTSPYRLEIAHKASGTVDGRIWAHFRDPYDDVSKYPAPWTWWMTGTRTDSVALRLLKWNGLKYEVLRAWTSPQTKNHTWDLLLAQAGECKGKPMCPLPRPEAQQKALEALDDRALSYLRVPVIEQLAEATIAGVQADPYGKIVSASVRVSNHSLWPITEFAVRVRWQAQTKTDAVVKASGQPFTKVGWTNFTRSVDLKGTIAPGKQGTLTSDPKETGPRGRDDGRGALSISQGVEFNRYAAQMEIIAVRFVPEGLAPAKP